MAGSFYDHSLSIDTKKLSRKVDRKLEEISLIVEDKLQKINYCKNGFLLDDYLKNMKSFNKEIFITKKKVKSSYRKRIKINTIQETIDCLHEGKSIEQIAFERNLAVGTIESHLSKAIRQDLIQLEEVIPLEEAKEIFSKFF